MWVAALCQTKDKAAIQLPYGSSALPLLPRGPPSGAACLGAAYGTTHAVQWVLCLTGQGPCSPAEPLARCSGGFCVRGRQEELKTPASRTYRTLRATGSSSVHGREGGWKAVPLRYPRVLSPRMHKSRAIVATCTKLPAQYQKCTSLNNCLRPLVASPRPHVQYSLPAACSLAAVQTCNPKRVLQR